jgi:hypothetical protein
MSHMRLDIREGRGPFLRGFTRLDHRVMELLDRFRAPDREEGARVADDEG